MMLNLKDDLAPSEIKLEVLRYGRKHGIPNLWWNVKLDMRSFHDGYAVCDYTRDKETGTATSSYFATREEAELALTELELEKDYGGILIHVVEDDWASYREGDMDTEFLAGQLAEFSRRLTSLEMTVFVMSLVLKQHDIDVVESIKELESVYSQMPEGRGRVTADVLRDIVNRFEGAKP